MVFTYTTETGGVGSGQSLYTITSPTGGIICDILMVGGGGGGGDGGGGGGGYVYQTNLTIPVGSYSVRVGNGGNGGVGATGSAGSQGASSSFIVNGTTYIAYGGGGGGAYNTIAPAHTIGQVGSYGGNGADRTVAQTYTSTQGNRGGTAISGSYGSGGGGGGAGAVGSDANFASPGVIAGSGIQYYRGGTGGNGLPNSITGTEVFYAGGGTGGANTNQGTDTTTQTPPIGGGGIGSRASGGLGGNGVDGTGGGGGGSDATSSTSATGRGGSGIVIIRFISPSSSSTIELLRGTNIDDKHDWKLGNYAGDFKVISSISGISTDRLTITSSGDLTYNGSINATSYLLGNVNILTKITETSNYVLSTSNILAAKVNLNDSNTSNYIASTSNILIKRLMDEDKFTSNYVLSTSNILVPRILSEVGFTSNYILSTSNILVPRILSEVGFTSNYVLSTSNILVNRILSEVGFGSNYVLSTSNILAARLNAINSGSFSQWTTSNNMIYYNTSNVGIGTFAPISKLHLYDIINNQTKLIVQNNSNIVAIVAEVVAEINNEIPREITVTDAISTQIGTFDKMIVFPYLGSATTKDYSFTPTENLICDILVVGGGGGGGANLGAGGGGGGILFSTNFNLNSDSSVLIEVGNGGAGDTNAQDGINGGSSSITINSVKYTANGGGGGGAGYLPGRSGKNGGSGGGAAHNNTINVSPIPGQVNNTVYSNFQFYGNAGGYGKFQSSGTPVGYPTNASGGGGGAGSVGFNFSSDAGKGGGDGGAGKEFISYFGTNVGHNGWFSGGGGGNTGYSAGDGYIASYYSYGNGGVNLLGGGGNGGGRQSTNNYRSPGIGIPNTGGGGGGSARIDTFNGAAGGSGIVIIRYRKIQSISNNVKIDLLYNTIGYGVGNYNGDFKIVSSLSGTNTDRLVLNESGNITLSGSVNATSYLLNNVNILTNISDTSNYILSTSNILVNRIREDIGFTSNYVLSTSNILVNYNNLINKPTIPAAQVSSDWTAVSGITSILNKPTIPAAQVSSDWTAVSGITSILNKPTLFSGSYTDLSNKPTIPAAQVSSDWTAVSGISIILNKPTLFSGSYTDLSNKPTIPAAQVSSDWTAVSGISIILNKPTLFSGSYTDLSNKPTIPAAQVSSDWSAVSGITSILNKPTIPTGSKWTAGATATNIYYSAGNVGIGTSATSDADDNVNLAIPTATLFVKGGASAAGTCDVVIRGGVAGGDNGKARLWLAADASHSSYIQSQHTGSGNTQLTFGTSIGNALPAERMIIGTDGCLYINNTNYENASATSGFKLLVSGSDSNGVCAKFFHPNRTQGLGIQYDGLSGLSANQNIIMRPSGTGNFQVVGDATVSGNVYVGASGGASTIFLGGGAAGDNDFNMSTIASRNYSGTENTEIIIFKGNDVGTTAVADRIRLRAGAIVFDTFPGASNDRTAENIRMVINGSGNVGIGNTAPLGPLHLADGTQANNDGHIIFAKCTTLGSTRMFRAGVNDSFQFCIGDVGGGNTLSTWVNSFKMDYTAPANSVYIDSTGNLSVLANVTAYVSDMRLKTKTANISEPLKIIDKLNGFYYTLNDVAKLYGIKNTRQEIGLSAQEIQKVLPELVHMAPFDKNTDEHGNITSKSGDNYLTISYDRLAPVFVEAIKELNQKNISLTNENIELKEKYNKLLEDIKSQEDRIKELETNMAHILNYISK